MSRQWKMMQNLESNWLVVSKFTWEIRQTLTQALGSLKNLHFNGHFLTKVYNVWAKKVQKRYFSWHWKVMQNLKKNWPVVWNMTRGTGKSSQEHSKISKSELWWDPFIQSRRWMSLKFTEWRMKNDAVWRGFDLSFQFWHEKFDKFWTVHWKV